KDSLATLLLVKDVVSDFEVMFADTGLEFPETVDNVEIVAKEYNLDIKTSTAKTSFWDSVNQFGPPTVQSRWCCKVCKLGPLSQLIEDNFEDGVLSFIGQRRYESHARAKSDPIWKNPWVANQTGASPIQNWIALEVWLYIFYKNAPYNPAYEMGYDRIGCWLCPSASMADFTHLCRTHPKLHAQLDTYLSGYAEECGYPQKWKELGLWRWQNLPKPQQIMAEKYGIKLVPKRSAKELVFDYVSGYRPCKAGGMSAEGSFNVSLDLENLYGEGALLPLGKCAYMNGVIMVNPPSNDGAYQPSIQIFASGTVVVRGRNEKDAKKLIERTKIAIHRALLCVGCGVCIGHCDTGAIHVEHTNQDAEDVGAESITADSNMPHAVTGDKCNHCGRCITECPAVKFQA
ncbi:MAG: phosphoadenosine phosphosulfate reductase family protein, partial [Methanosarcinales archaeon]|nr:phosphoadenosine phosphosulfate reductase family protein [Methanosarcinales archaeon]